MTVGLHSHQQIANDKSTLNSPWNFAAVTRSSPETELEDKQSNDADSTISIGGALFQ